MAIYVDRLTRFSVPLRLKPHRLTGLDRDLYSSVPQWPEGSYRGLSDTEGELTLLATGITRPESLALAQAELNERAQKFRLALSYRTGCPLLLKLHRADIPDVDPTGVMRAHSTVGFSVSVQLTVLPGAPPDHLPQLPLDSARWVYTLTETHRLGDFPDEVLKRLYLLIEELWPRFSDQASVDQRLIEHEAKLLRDFVSHPRCDGKRVVDFIKTNLPSALVVGESAVQFDRTNIDHVNFIGRFEPRARDLTKWLVDRAILALDSGEAR